MTGPRSHPSTSLRVTTPLERLNVLDKAEAIDSLTRCCGSMRWVQEMVERRPFASRDSVFEVAGEIWWRLSESDWREAFARHPKIGDIDSLKRKFATTADLALREQAGTSGASEDVLNRLAQGNTRYEEKFGYIFIVCATGKSAAEMLDILNARLPNSPEVEIKIAAGEQAKITRLRLEAFLSNPQREPRIGS